MKLIVRDYLKALREDGELDRLLVDLLSQMGLKIQSSPKKGVAQSGVDLWATGKLPKDNEESVYLVSVKRGNLTRDNWDSGKQAMRPSLNEILDDFIPHHIPKRFAGKRIVVCIAIGGEIASNVQQDVKGFEERAERTHAGLCIREWNGDCIAGWVCQYLLSAKLFCGEKQRLFFRALAMVQEPEASLHAFRQFVSHLFQEPARRSEWVRNARAGILSLAILGQYCQDVNNLEASFLGAEYFQLLLWGYVKRAREKKLVDEKEIISLLVSSLHVVRMCQARYLSKFALLSDGRYHLSLVVPGHSILNVNLRLFDLLGRAASFGLASMFWVRYLEEAGKGGVSRGKMIVETMRQFIREMIKNNPSLQYPIRDDFSIEISLAAQFLAKMGEHKLLHWWLTHMVDNIHLSMKLGRPVMCVFKDYPRLVALSRDPGSFKETALPSSEMIPTIAVISMALGFSDIYEQLRELVRQYLPATDLQLWYPASDAEEHFFTGGTMYGRQLVSLPLDEPTRFLEIVLHECEESPFCLSCGAIAPWLVFSSCRLHRIPVPIHYWLPLLKKVQLENEVCTGRSKQSAIPSLQGK